MSFAYDVDIHCKLKHRCMCAKVVPTTAKPAGKRTRGKTNELFHMRITGKSQYSTPIYIINQI